MLSLKRIACFLRAGLAGAAATLVDIGTLAILVSGFHLDPHVASFPALLAGAIANFVGNRHYVFRAQEGSLVRQALLYSFVEVMALALNAALYDVALRLDDAPRYYWVVRLFTSNLVFVAWSYPLWRRVFAVTPGSRALQH